MKSQSIPVGNLTEALLRKHPVWEFTNDDESDETLVRPVKKLPVTSGDGRLFGCELRFADGSEAFGMIGNLSLKEAEQNTHFRTISVFLREGSTIFRATMISTLRSEGPAATAKKIGKNRDQIFPISYDLSAVAKGAVDCIRGSIPAEPKNKLSRSELIQMAVG